MTYPSPRHVRFGAYPQARQAQGSVIPDVKKNMDIQNMVYIVR